MDLDDSLSLIPTKAMLTNKEIISEFKATVFESHKRKVNQSDDPDSNLKKTNSKKNIEIEENLFDIKKARHEVLNFGLTGFDKEAKEKAKIFMAVKLGAKPPKREYKNYKEILEEKKRAKEEIDNKNKLQQLGKNSLGLAEFNYKKFSKKRRSRGDNEVLKDYGVPTLKLQQKNKKNIK